MHGKTLFKILAVLIVLAQLVACTSATPTAISQPTSAPATGNTAAPAPSGGKLPQIVVAVWSSPEHDNLVKDVAVYEEETGNKVVVEEIARESYNDKLNTVLLAGGSDYDAFYIVTDWAPAWVKANALADLTPFITDPKVASPTFKLDSLKPGVNFFTFDNKVYAFPSDGDTAWLWYRKDIFDAKGIKVPETWDEYLDAAKKLNNPPDMYGAVIGAKPDEALWDFMYYLLGMGGGFLDKDSNVLINNETGVKALQYYAGLLQKEKVVPPDVATYGYNEILTALQQGKAAMGIEWMAATMTLQDCTQSPKVCKDGQPLLQYTKTPGVKQADGSIKRATGASQWGWAIPSGSKNKEAAYKFIEWLTSKEGATNWALNGGIPSNMDALLDPQVTAKVPQFKLLAEVMPTRNVFPATTVSGSLVNYFNEAINSAVAGAKDPKAALDDAAAKMTDELKKAGYIK